MTQCHATDYLGESLEIANQAATVEEALQGVLAHLGKALGLNWVFVLEEKNGTFLHAYEWRSKKNRWTWSWEPVSVSQMQAVFSAGNEPILLDDVAALPEEGRRLLQSAGVCAMATLPLMRGSERMGIVTFINTAGAQAWGEQKGTLGNIASVLTSLLIRRNAEAEYTSSRKTLQTISDSIENIIYVNDIDTHELVFVNKALADSMGTEAAQFIGRRCWQQLQRGMVEPCPFCPMPVMKEKGYLESGRSYTWEFQNTVNGKWYLIKDAFIKWIDGRTVHIETAMEITHQKEYEEQLKYYASTDPLTGAYNREWGYKIMQEMMTTSGDVERAGSLVFIDLDGLKRVNDACGHDMGDHMINRMVQVVRSSIRKSDALCRWGGDEFLLLLRCKTEVAERIMRTVTEKMREFNESKTTPYELSISYGITELSSAANETVDEIIARADQLMYQQKESKRAGNAAKA